MAGSPAMTLPPALGRPFRIVVFDWDGTAVRDRREDASELGDALLALLDAGVALVIVSGTHVGNVAGQLALADKLAREGRRLPRGLLHAAVNRGSEVYTFDEAGHPVRVAYRQATPAENAALDRTASRLAHELGERTGLAIEVVADRLNRRKIDLIPLEEWRDPPKERLGDLLRAVEARFREAGMPKALAFALERGARIAAEEGLASARITSDAKHVEIGLTDKSDAMRWVVGTLAPALGVPPEQILVAGDEFGPIAGFPGSDSRLRIPEASRATFVSVGPEPEGVPEGVVGLGGGPTRFLEILRDQLGRALPGLPEVFVPTLLDPAWLLVEEPYVPASEHDVESRFALSNGYSGTRGSLMEGGRHSRPGTFLAGVFDPGRAGFPELVICPFWASLSIAVAGEAVRLDSGEVLLHRRMLDMRRATLLRVWRHRTPEGRVTRIHEARWASLGDRHAFYQRVWLVPENYSGPIELLGKLDARIQDLEGDVHLVPVQVSGEPLLVARTRTSGIEIAFAGAHEARPAGSPARAAAGEGAIEVLWLLDGRMQQPCELIRHFSAYTTRDTVEPAPAARAHVANLAASRLADIERCHAEAWQGCWNASDVRVEGDPAAQRALRFAIYHLVGAVNPDDPGVSVGAKALTGEGYKGHVFWDTEAYMLPFYLHTQPRAARTLLMYRHRTLGAARERARAIGCRGALYAWESACDGQDATPPVVIGFDGSAIPILTGRMAHHVSSAVGQAVWRYWLATGDDAFMREAGAEILLEVARFWACRAEEGPDGRLHLRHVIGPDEYHEDVDDNAYTNGMARAMLEYAAFVHAWLKERYPADFARLAAAIGLEPGERSTWLDVADKLVTGFDPARGIHEQFAGYFELEDLPLPRSSGPFIPLEILLGRERLQRSQIIKQADVVWLVNQLWERFPPEVRLADYRYYEPRTAHGSSLSPGSYALVAARLGLIDEAMRYFRVAASIDLDNQMGNASEGVHAAALGALWQIVVFGFAGLDVCSQGLRIRPAMPAEWQSLEFPFMYRGQRIDVRLTADRLIFECPGAIEVALGEDDFRGLPGGRHEARREKGAWRWQAAT